MTSTNFECYKKLRLAAVMEAVAATTLVAAMAAAVATMLVAYTIVACSALYKQLCWEFGASHNCVCIVSEGPLMYVVTCLETIL